MPFNNTAYQAPDEIKAKFPDIIGGNGPDGIRFDGTNKGGGFASFNTPDGGRASEITVGMPGPWGNRNDMYRPLIYEGIPPWEVEALQNAMNFDAPRVPGAANIRLSDRSLDPVFENSYLQAIVRQGQGKTPFYEVDKDEMPAFGYNMCIPQLGILDFMK